MPKNRTPPKPGSRQTVTTPWAFLSESLAYFTHVVDALKGNPNHILLVAVGVLFLVALVASLALGGITGLTALIAFAVMLALVAALVFFKVPVASTGSPPSPPQSAIPNRAQPTPPLPQVLADPSTASAGAAPITRAPPQADPLTRSISALAGQRLGKYQVGAQRFHDGTNRIFDATRIRDGRAVLIKEILDPNRLFDAGPSGDPRLLQPRCDAWGSGHPSRNHPDRREYVRGTATLRGVESQ